MIERIHLVQAAKNLRESGFLRSAANVLDAADEIEHLRAQLADLQAKQDALARMWNAPEGTV